MTPFSRGTVLINSTDAFQQPTIDPRYGSNPVDLLIIQDAIRFNYHLLDTPSMSELQVEQLVPGPNASDEEISAFINTGLSTMYHPAGTCVMMPQRAGGVVDENLVVYGTSNLRVVDASIFPLLPAGHIMSVVYAVAEKVSELYAKLCILSISSTCQICKCKGTFH